MVSIVDQKQDLLMIMPWFMSTFMPEYITPKQSKKRVNRCSVDTNKEIKIDEERVGGYTH